MKTKGDYIKPLIEENRFECQFKDILQFHINEKFLLAFANEDNLLKIKYLIIEIFNCFYPLVSYNELNKFNVRYDETFTQMKLDLGLYDDYLNDIWSKSIIREEKLNDLGI